jgi:hypothetical protein
MNAFRKTMFVPGLAAAIALLCGSGCDAARFPRSPDGKYEAVRLKDEKGGIHFQVKEVEGGRVVLTTNAQYETPNDVKAGKFSADSTKLAVAYHYDGPSTWVGVWSLKTGKRLGTTILKGCVTSIPDFVFEDDEKKGEAGEKQSEAATTFPRSPNGKYEAAAVRGENGGSHFQVKEVEGGRVVLTTSAQYETPNDVKAGKFSADSTKLAAAYHYGHAGQYTWVGLWSLKTGERVGMVILKGWTEIIPDSVFDEKKSE